MNLLVPLPKDILVCCSGGVDSIAAAHWLSKNHNVTIYHFHHLNSQSDEMQKGVERFCRAFSLPLICRRANRKFKREAEFRTARLAFISENAFDVITAHTLQDATEQYFMNFCTGSMRIIPMNVISCIGKSKVYHPFLTTDKLWFEKYSLKNKLASYITVDKTNADPSYCRRNWTRHDILPQLQSKQIGIKKIVRKQYLRWKKSVLNSSNTGEPPLPQTN